MRHRLGGFLAAATLLFGLCGCASAADAGSGQPSDPSAPAQQGARADFWLGSHPAASPAPSPATSPAARTAPDVVGLGDSVPAGAQCDCTPFPQLLAKELAHRAGAAAAAVQNLAQGGETSQDLLGQLQDTGVQARIAKADVVLVTIGANDFDPSQLPAASCSTGGECAAQERSALSSTLGSILERIGQLAPGARVLVTGYWNVFLDGTVGRQQGEAYMRESDALTKAVNAVIEAAASRAGDTYVDLYGPFKGDDGAADPTGLLAPDGDHPDAAGHAVIAARLLAALSAG